jgi:hypothetical protein
MLTSISIQLVHDVPPWQATGCIGAHGKNHQTWRSFRPKDLHKSVQPYGVSPKPWNQITHAVGFSGPNSIVAIIFSSLTPPQKKKEGGFSTPLLLWERLA